MKSFIIVIAVVLTFFSTTAFADNTVCKDFIEKVEENLISYSEINLSEKEIFLLLAKKAQKESLNFLTRLKDPGNNANYVFTFEQMNKHLQISRCLTEKAKNIK